MKKHLLYSFLFFFIQNTFSQSNLMLNPEEKAYFFHIVKKSPILDTNLGRYFEYKGPIFRFPNKDLNYDSIEEYIINHPEILVIRSSEIAKAPKGVLSEAANKVALWELNKTLQAKRVGGNEFQNFVNQYMAFEKELIPHLPENAFKIQDEQKVPHPKLDQLLNPTLSFNDKRELISTYHFLDLQEQKITLEALNKAVNAYTEKRTRELFQLLGGQAAYFKNELIAAGDGSSTSGLLEEREKDEKGRWNKGLPKAVGLFPYQIEIKAAEKAKKSGLEPLRFPVLDFETAGNNKLTNIHCDVWGYNATKQTTVVIEKNGLTYHLFGSEETRFLSPDSTFSKGKTFQAVINNLEFVHIGKLNEQIEGKKGFDYQIDYHIKKRDETELMIEKQEKAYSDFGYTPISTKSKASRKVKKARKKNRKKGGGPLDVQPTTNSNKKKKRNKQNTIIDLYNQYEFHKKRIAELTIERQEAIDTRAKYQRRLDYYKQLMGFKWATFTEKDGLYIFEDSATFDIYTQEFVFPAEKEKTPFEVKLLSIPSNGLSDIADEVMMHVNVCDAKPNYNAKVQLQLSDVFASDKWELKQKLLSIEDSLSVRQFFEALQVKKMDFNVIVRAQGVGKWNGAIVVKERDTNFRELAAYPSKLAKNDSTFSRLRFSEVLININRSVLLEINSFTDPVASNLELKHNDLRKLVDSYKLSKNEVLSMFRSYQILMKLKEELNVYAGNLFPRDQANDLIDKLNKEINKVKIVIGATSVPLNDVKAWL